MIAKRFSQVTPAPEYGALQSSADCLRIVVFHHFYRFIEVVSASSFVGRFCFREFAGAIADVAGLGDLRADVVVQVAGEMQDEMADAVAVGEWIFPECSSVSEATQVCRSTRSFS